MPASSLSGVRIAITASFPLIFFRRKRHHFPVTALLGLVLRFQLSFELLCFLPAPSFRAPANERGPSDPRTPLIHFGQRQRL